MCAPRPSACGSLQSPQVCDRTPRRWEPSRGSRPVSVEVTGHWSGTMPPVRGRCYVQIWHLLLSWRRWRVPVSRPGVMLSCPCADEREFACKPPKFGWTSTSQPLVCISTSACQNTCNPLDFWLVWSLPTAVFITIDPVDSWRRKRSSSRTGTVRCSYQLPTPICLHTAIGSMFLTNAV